MSERKDGLLFIDKPAGSTSRHLDNFFMHFYDTRKVGHLGTLDPFATGLLILGVGEGTKLLPSLDDSVKSYQAVLQLGAKTDSGDRDGAVVDRAEVPPISRADLVSIFNAMIGERLQTPPFKSAIKVDGKPLYRYAAEQKKVEIKPRSIKIYKLSFLAYDPTSFLLSFLAQVSRGTYIRTLGEDIAEKLGTCGHLVELRRVQVGDVRIDSPLVSTLEDPHFVPLTEAAKIFGIPSFNIAPPYCGQDVRIPSNRPVVLGLDSELTPIGIYERTEDDIYHVRRGLNCRD